MNEWPYPVTTENYVYLKYVYYVNCICRSLEILEDIMLRNFLIMVFFSIPSNKFFVFNCVLINTKLSFFNWVQLILFFNLVCLLEI